jgi:hypothetical protein
MSRSVQDGAYLTRQSTKDSGRDSLRKAHRLHFICAPNAIAGYAVFDLWLMLTLTC